MISIVIYAEHGTGFLDTCLRSLAALPATEPEFEVLVIDSGNDADRPAAADALIVELGERFRYFAPEADTRRPALYNRAVAEASGEYVVFSHDDAHFRAGWLAVLTASFSDPDVAFVGGEDQAPPDQPPLLLALDYVLRSPVASGGMRRDRGIRFGNYAPRGWNMACRKSDLVAVGLFTPEAGEGAEAELANRFVKAGHRIRYVPEAIVFHVRETTLADTTRLNVRRGRNRGRRVGRSGWSREIPFVLVSFLTLGILVLPVAAALTPAHAPLLLVPVAGYALSLLGLGLHAAWRRRRLEVMLWTPLLIASQHLGHGAGYLCGLAEAVLCGFSNRGASRIAP